jgi:hypothetical protein
MSFLVANLPPIHGFVRREFLYDFKSGHGEYEPCIWVTIKSLRSQAFRIEAYLPRYGALYEIDFSQQLGRTIAGVSDIWCLAALATTNNDDAVGIVNWQEHN